MYTFIFDVETTGLAKIGPARLSDQPHVIEFACVLISPSGRTVDQFDTLINPGKAISPKITEITTIENDDLVLCKRFPAYMTKIQQMMDQATTVVAHNLSFDMQMLDFEAQRMGVKFNWPKNKVCTVAATEHFKGFRQNLQSLYGYLFPGLVFSNAHRAKFDVEALRKVFLELKKRGLVNAVEEAKHR